MARVAAILAAGKGTRMKSDLPKVLHPVGGRPMLSWVLDAARSGGCDRILVIVGHGAEQVRASLDAPDVVFVEQREQLGTGHALAQVAGELRDTTGEIVVLSGDVPLVRASTISALGDAAAAGWGSMAVADLDAPGSLGRVMVSESGGLDRIVEASDACPSELEVRTINAGLYCLPYPEIFDYLERLEPDNVKGEFYLTDALGDAAAERQVALVELEDPTEAIGINTRADQARVHRRLLERKLAELLEDGVTVVDPARTQIEPGVTIGRDTVIHPDVDLNGATKVGDGCTLRQGAWLRDSELADGVTVEPYSVLDGARVGPGCSVGPFARLRPGTVLEDGAKVGNFVEIKKSTLKPGVKAGHLAYLGDATIGEGANIGAGTITCNYDGVNKHTTEIGEGAFIGSDTMLVAPVKVGAGATTGAGSVIGKDVPSGALAIERSRQRNIEGWSTRKRPKRESED